MTVGKFRKSKFRNVPTLAGGIRFHSKFEANRYCELKMAERAGEIRKLERQVRFELRAGPNDFVVERYVSDFTYHEKQDGVWVFVCEDVKGFETSDYKRKRKWMKEVHGIEIREVRL